MGLLGLLKEIGDLVLVESEEANHSGSAQAHANFYELLHYTFDGIVKALRDNATNAVLFSMDPLAMKCVQFIQDGYNKDLERTNKTSVAISERELLSNIAVLKFPLERAQLSWNKVHSEIIDLVKLGDKYLKKSLWVEAESAYHEATQLLTLIATFNLEHIDHLARLSFIGYGNALFAQRRFLEACGAIRLGLHWFPTFPLLPFDPRDHYKNSIVENISDYDRSMFLLDAQEYGLTTSVKDLKDLSNPECRELHLLRFLLAYQFHFTNNRSQAREMFVSLSSLRPSKIRSEEDEDQDDVEPMNFQVEAGYFLKDVTVNRSTASNQTIEFVNVDMVDTSLKQLKVWCKRLFDPMKGIQVKTRKKNLTFFKNSFFMCDAVSFISENGCITRDESVEFLQRMMDRNAFVHVYDQFNVVDRKELFVVQYDILEVIFEPILMSGDLSLKCGPKWVCKHAVLHQNGLIFLEDGPCTRVWRKYELGETNAVKIGLPASIATDPESIQAETVFTLSVNHNEPTSFCSDDRGEWMRGFLDLKDIKIQLFD
ncbi:hypothetical protein AKO1_015605 [Acrasis kona]|uniref:DEP domain-containing protein n=1 Tax=Acrasis kona TaxID=1008807 RepID=A0AAW2ZFA5_9EUKA